MAGLDAALRRVAKRVVATLGTTVTVRQLSTTAYDPATGAAVSYVETAVPARVDDYREFAINGTSIRAGDRRFTIAAASLEQELTANDRLTWQGRDYDIVNVARTYGQDEAVLYVVQAR